MEPKNEIDAHFILQTMINQACLRGITNDITIEIPWQNLETYMKSGGTANFKGANLKLTISTKWIEQQKEETMEDTQ